MKKSGVVPGTIFFHFMCIIVTFYSGTVLAEKILIYDEEKGIISVDKENYKSIQKQNKQRAVKKDNDSSPNKEKSFTDLHENRRKDPPELYFKSGLEYYKSGDYQNAIKNFKYAADKSLKPVYLLWIGKTYRQLEKTHQMFSIMERIIQDYPESDVADDALFEIAFFYQRNGNYHEAMKKYAQLAEQYPFGTSFSNGEAFLEVSRRERRRMRGEMFSALKVLGIEGETLQEIYTKFQKASGVHQTGLGDSETVNAIKQKYSDKLISEKKKAASIQYLQKSVTYAWIAVLVLIISFILHISLFFKIKQSRFQLNLLKEMLSEL